MPMGLSAASPTCPACASRDLRDGGPVQRVGTFALDLPFAECHQPCRLWRCRGCDLTFKHPRLAPQAYVRYYQAMAPGEWPASPHQRVDWTLAAGRIASSHARSVLDLGCWDGRFLASLDVERRIGVEMNVAAARIAQSKGIILAGDRLEQVALGQRVDAACAFDVIEHLADPAMALRALAQSLREGGLALLSTGDPDHWRWRLMRGAYWYAALPAHVAFPSRRWMERQGREAGLALEASIPFSHLPPEQRTVRRRTKEALANAVALGRRLVGGSRALDRLREAPVGWATATDHRLYVLRRC